MNLLRFTPTLETRKCGFALLVTSLSLMNFLYGRSSDSLAYDFARLGVSSGFVAYGNTDGYLSDSRYAGSFAPISVDWNRFARNRGFHFGVQITNVTDIDDEDISNLTADVLDLKISSNHYYGLNPIELFKKDLKVYLGPGYGIQVYERLQNVAQGGTLEDEVSSVLVHIPLRMNARSYLTLSDKWELISEVGLGLLSFGIRSDLEDDAEVKILATNRHFEVLFDITLQYEIAHRLGAFVAFKNRWSRITGWDQDLHIGQTGGEIGMYVNLAKKNR